MEQKLSYFANRVIDSTTFKKYNSGKELLRFLVESSLKGEVPKETTIAAHVFGHEEAKDFDTGKTRVYVHNLRKRLATYYQEEGISDEYQIRIPKGSYQLILEKRGDTKSYAPLGVNLVQRRSALAFLAATFLVLIISTVFYFKRPSQSIGQSSKLWSDILTSNKPLLIVLGDMYIFEETNRATGKKRTIREYQINTSQEFEKLVEDHQDTSVLYEPHHYSFLIQNSADWIRSVTYFLTKNNKDFQIRMRSKVSAKDLRDYDIVFIGLQKSMGIFMNYFQKSHFEFTQNGTYLYTDSTNQQEFKPFGKPNLSHVDYGFIGKFNGPNKNQIVMLSGLWDGSVTQSLKCFTDKKLSDQISAHMSKKWNKVPDQYEVLLEVKALDRTDLDSKILLTNTLVD